MTTNDQRRLDYMIAGRLATFRQARGMTQADVAKVTGLSIGSIGRFERACGRPCLANLMKLCAALDCTPNDILVDDGVTLRLVQ